jgi:hypothetical protein
MRKLIYTIGTLALVVAAIFVWSRTALVSPEAGTAVSLNHGTAVLSGTSEPISPTELTIRRSGVLAIEQWDAF